MAEECSKVTTGSGLGAYRYNGEVVVSGISCRLPESDNMEEFKDNLINGVDMVTEDDRRWKPGAFGLPKRNGKLKDISKFDAAFFGVHPKQAASMDPQLRSLLEVTFEAIIDAGVNPEIIRGSKTGVFIGAQQSARQGDAKNMSNGYALIGNALSMFPNRLSYFFDFKGPSVNLDTACSSSLYALNQALMSIRANECDAAIVGGSNLCLKPEMALKLQNLGMLSEEGMCRSFDNAGKGYCRSEGIIAIYLQKEDIAKRIYCTLVHSKVNSDGNKPHGITFPSGEVQKVLLESTCQEAGVDPRDVIYVEAHGTGTPAGDPQECSSISETFCKDRERPLLIGSVKSNMGHCESASGMASMAKIIIAMETGVIPANLHYKEPNENIPSLKNGTLQVVDKNTDWSGGLVGLNSFGFGGANAHVLLKSNSNGKSSLSKAANKQRLFVYGSRTQEGVESVMKLIQSNPRDLNLHKLLNETANLPMEKHPYRGFLVINSHEGKADIQESTHLQRQVWFVFSGMGSQWSGMGRKMMEIEVFRNSILKLNATLKPHGIDLCDIIMEGMELTGDVLNSFVGITSIQIALVDMLTCMGITPDGIVGHSVGELGCAYADGSLTAEEAVLAAFWRGYCVQQVKLPPGGMAAVGLSWQEALKHCPPGVVPACHNAEGSVTVSGPAESIKRFVEELQEKGLFAKEVDSAGIAFHSYFLEDVAPVLKSALDKVIIPKPRTEKWISSSFRECDWSSDVAKSSSADYHVHNFLNPVLFHDAISHIPNDAVVLEIAPHCLLQSILKRSLDSSCCIVGLMKRDCSDNVDFCLTSLGRCYQNGLKLDPLALLPPTKFPIPRGTPMLSPTVRWNHSQSWAVESADIENDNGSSFNIDLSKDSEYRFFLDHKIDGRPIFPGAGYFVLVWKALANREGKQWDQMPILFEDVNIHNATMLAPETKIQVDVSFLPGSDKFQLLIGQEVVVNGTVTIPDNKTIGIYFSDDVEKIEETDMELKAEDLYKCFRLKGYEYGPSFQRLRKSTLDGNYGLIEWTEDWIQFIDTVTQLSILMTPDLSLPTRITCLAIDPEQHKKRLRKIADDSIVADVYISPYDRLRKAGGVHMHGVVSRVSRRTVPTQGTHESYQFVPYERSLSLKAHEQSLLEYTKACKTLALAGGKKQFGDKLVEMIPFCEDTLDEVITGSPSTEKYFKDPKSHSFLQVLSSVFDITKDEDKNISDILASKVEDLQSDALLGNLLQVEYLKPCVDIVKENAAVRNLRVLEIYRAGMSDQIFKLLTADPHRSTSYSVATRDQAVIEQLSMGETVKEVVKWEPGFKTPVDKFSLVVANNTVRRSKSIRKTLRGMSEILTEGGFLLIQEVTTNFYMVAPLDGIVDSSTQAYEDLDKRTCSIYCNQSTWRQVLAEEGFDIIYEVSDNLLSSLFLLKRNITHLTATPIVLDVTQLSCAWVDDLKSTIEELNDKPNGRNLWLRADDSNSGILGMVNCLRKEPGGHKIRCLFNMDGTSAEIDDGTVQEIVRRDLIMNVYKNGQWGSFRHLPLESVRTIPSTHAYVDIERHGDLSGLTWYQSPLRYHHTSEASVSEICDVHYASLNFRDVMLASGKLPLDAIPGFHLDQGCMLGMEFSGTDTKGNRVMGLVPKKGLATVVEANKNLIWEVPDNWSLEEAATVPVVYTTIFYALVIRGNIQCGNSVLIHSGSGGVGQAAIRVALHYGCEVFTTVSSDEKKKYLKERFPELEDSHFFNSRDRAFELGILAATSWKGVDVVLNSLAEDKLQASVRVLANHGKFLEIGKVDLANNSALGMSIFLKNVTFHGILMDSLFDAKNDDIDVVSSCLTEGIKSGIVKPLQSTVFDADDVAGAFRFMAKGKHIGKVLIKVRTESKPTTVVPAFPRSACHPDKTYIITGGLGGFGLELAPWLVKRGAKSLVLTSRSGVKTGYQRKMLSYLKHLGAEVTVSSKDVCDEEEVKLLFRNVITRPVGGVFHLAMVLKDSLLENQTEKMFQAVCEPKVTGTINLDLVTRKLCKETLDWFVVFSSISSGYGNAGQSNYGFANSSMERIIEQRRNDGYPGLAIQWGPVGDVGVFMNTTGNNETVMLGTIPQRITSCLQSLDILLNQPKQVVCSYAAADKAVIGQKNSGEDLVQAICKILGVENPESVSEDRSFNDFGLDSILGVEIKLTLENNYNIHLNSKEIRELSIRKLKVLAKNKDGEIFDKDLDLLNVNILRKDLILLPSEVLIKANDVQEGTPLFFVHHMFGTLNGMEQIMAQIQVPVYGLQRTVDVPQESMRDLVDYYVKLITEQCRGEAFHLAGYSFGACIALEMATQIQNSKPEGLSSLTLLDGSHKIIHKFVDIVRNERTDVRHQLELILVNDIEVNAKSTESADDILEKATSNLLAVRPDLSLEEAKAICRGTQRGYQLQLNYQPNQTYQGDIILIAAERTASNYGLPSDYGLKEFCTGKISVHVVPGSHTSFIANTNSDGVAEIINNVVTT